MNISINALIFCGIARGLNSWKNVPFAKPRGWAALTLLTLLLGR